MYIHVCTRDILSSVQNICMCKYIHCNVHVLCTFACKSTQQVGSCQAPVLHWLPNAHNDHYSNQQLWVSKIYYIHAYTYIYMYVFMYVCVRVCVHEQWSMCLYGDTFHNSTTDINEFTMENNKVILSRCTCTFVLYKMQFLSNFMYMYGKIFAIHSMCNSCC